MPRFFEVLPIVECLVILVVAVPIYTFYYYVRDKLGLFWRRWLTRDFLGSYFSNRSSFWRCWSAPYWS